MADNKENRAPRSKFSIWPSRRGWRREIRHHNPGTRRRSRTPRVRMLSSIVVVPPRPTPTGPSPPTTRAPPNIIPLERPHTSTDHRLPDINVVDRLPLHEPMPLPWFTPPDIQEPPVEATWKKVRALIPEATTDYHEGFHIPIGKAYDAVPLYINRDLPWRLTPITMSPRRRIHFYRSDINDPRMYDFRVEVPMLPQEQTMPAFTTPQRISDEPTSTSEGLQDLFQSLEGQYICPTKPTSRIPESTATHAKICLEAHPVLPAPTPRSPSPPPGPSHAPAPPLNPQLSSSERGVSENLAALIRLARLFGPYPPPAAKGPEKGSKRPYRKRRE